MYGYIYKTTNIINQKIYIGQHKASEFKGQSYLGSGCLFRQAVNKYGKQNFFVELIDTAESREELDKKEQYWISYYNSRDKEIGYNQAPGGSVGNTGCKQSEHQKMVVREYMQTHPRTDACKKAMSVAAKRRCARTGYTVNQTGKIFVTKNGYNTVIYPEKLQEYLDAGYTRGRKMSDDGRQRYKERYANGIYIHKGAIIKNVLKTDLDMWLHDGWSVGRK